MFVTFSIPGEPVAKGRPRFVRNGNFVRAVTPEKTAMYENLIKLEYERIRGPFFEDEMIGVAITAYYSIPKSISKKKKDEILRNKIRPTRKPDIDNIIKIVCDALNGTAYRDDSKIVEINADKQFAEIPSVNVTIYSVKEGN